MSTWIYVPATAAVASGLPSRHVVVTGDNDFKDQAYWIGVLEPSGILLVVEGAWTEDQAASRVHYLNGGALSE